jgi:hypothetical protein
MPDTAPHGKQDGIREHFERLVGRLDRQFPPAIPEAMKAVLTAMEYNDPALIKSHLNTAFEALKDLISDAIETRLGRPLAIRDGWLKIRKELSGRPAEDYDELGEEIESVFDELLADMVNLLEGPVRMLQDRDYAVENAGRLETETEELKKLKEDILSLWPWSSQELPPVNRKMVTESRAAIARGEGESIEVLIRRLQEGASTRSQE